MRYTVFILSIIVLLSSCKKEDPVDIEVPADPIQEQSDKRVLIEAFTNVSCGACPLAHHAIEEVEKENENVLHITHYLRGPMNHPYTQYVRDNVKSVSFTPQAIIQRFSSNGAVQHFGPEEYAEIVEKELEEALALELSVDASLDGTILKLVNKLNYIGENELDQLRLTAMIVDKVVVGDDFDYHQRNYGHEDPNHPYFGQGKYIEGFEHTNVLHRIITPVDGETVMLTNSRETLELETEIGDLTLDEYAVIVIVSPTHKQDILNAFYFDLADL